MTKKIVSILLVLVLAVSLFAGSSLAAAGDANGDLNDFPFLTYNSLGRSVVVHNSSTEDVLNIGTISYGSSNRGFFACFLPFPLASSGSLYFDFVVDDSLLPSGSTVSVADSSLYVFDSSLNLLSSFNNVYGTSISLPVLSSILIFHLTFSTSFSQNRPIPVLIGLSTYEGFSYVSSGGGSSYDPSLDQDILSGVEAIAKSLLVLKTGPYTTTSGVSLNSNGVVTSTTIQQATLQQLLSLIGASSTYSGLVLEQMNLNFGNYFEYHEIEDTSSGTVTVVKNLPSYVNALGMELTDGLNKLQRDNLMIFQQGEDLKDALYTDKTENQPWSVAQWLKDIYTAITSFFSSFWSPAETALKTAAEDGMQAAADNGNAASGSQVDDVHSAANAFKSFGSTGNIGSGDVMDIFSDGASYDFFSQTTKDNLTYHPPAGSQRMLRSSSPPSQSDQSEEEYVYELDDKLSYWREVLGLP